MRMLNITASVIFEQNNAQPQSNHEKFSSVAQLRPTLCDAMNQSMPGLPVHHQLPEFIQTHVHWVGGTISSSVGPFSSCLQFFPASGSFLMRWLFASGAQSIGASASTSVLPMNTQDWSTDSQESSPTAHFKSINSSALSLFYGPTLTSIHDYCKNHSFD